MHTTFRPDCKLLSVGLLLLVPSMGMAMMLPLHWAGKGLQGADVIAVWCFGLLGIGGSYVSGLMVAAHFRTQLTLSDTTITIRRVFREWQFDISSVQKLRWNPTQLQFDLATAIPKFDINAFSPEDQLQITRTLRQLVPHSLQENWAEFCHRIALPLREGRKPLYGSAGINDPNHLPESDRVFVTRRYYDRFFAAITVLTILVAVVVERIFNWPRALLMPISVAFLWLVIRFSTPKGGIWSTRWLATTRDRFIGFTILSVAIFSLTLRLLRLAGVPRQFEWAILLFVGLPFLGYLVYQARRLEKDAADRVNDQAATSVERWEAAEKALVE